MAFSAGSIHESYSVILVPVTLTIFFLLFLGSRYWRLRHIPGPFAASLSNLWAAVKIWRGEYYHIFIQELHKTYGPVVRWGPNRVSFASPAAIPVIYGTQNVFPKAASYNPLIVLARGEEIPTLITIRDEKRLSEMKRHISAGFSQSTWLKQESQIDSTLQSLVARLRDESGEQVELDTWLRYWAFDTLTLLAFSESRQYLQNAADVDGIFPASKERFSHWRLWSSVPSLESFLFKNRIVQYFQKSSSGLARLAMKQIQTRQTGDKQATGRDLMGRYLAASQQAPEVIRTPDVLALTISTIHAGSETVATICAAIMARVLGTPEVYAQLEEEISSAKLAAPAAFREVDKLPLLDAVTREALRLAVNPNCTERTVSPEGTEICNTWIPAGTDVSISDVLVARDPGVFGGNSDTFMPQRWLDADEKRFREMEKASFHFSFGRRECIGKHLAMIEIKKCIATLISSFKMSLVEQPKRGFNQNVGFTEVKVWIRERP